MKKLVAEIDKELDQIDNKRDGDITDEMITAARNYPIEKLVEFTNGVALAFCHDDKRPSLAWDRKRNRATCFPCGKSYNTIDVLMQRDGCTFQEAVRRLS